MPEQGEQDDDGKGDAEKPKQNGTHDDDLLL
jgi:hypothetical protein